ncbi:hypothetical protein OSTOST_18176 [Ostertagia ostertagi]
MEHELVKSAFEELMGIKMVQVTAKVTARHNFNTSDHRSMEEKVLIAVRGPLDRKKEKIRGLAAGTLFGCNGIVIKNYKKTINRIEIACLYMTVREDRREDTSENLINIWTNRSND